MPEGTRVCISGFFRDALFYFLGEQGYKLTVGVIRIQHNDVYGG